MDLIKPCYFCFNNAIFDTETNTQVKPDRSYYITQTTGYNYTPPTAEQIKVIEDLMKSILPDEEERRCYVSVLRTGLIGKQTEKFILAQGVGGNGKTVINEMQQSLLGPQYFYKGSTTTLTQPSKNGPSPEIANMNLKRFVIFSEPEESEQMRVSAIKELTGGAETNARGCFKNGTSTSLCPTIVCETNHKPKLNGSVDDGIQRRFINIIFKQVFKMPDVNGNVPKGCIKGNPIFKTKEFQTTHRIAFFHYLLKFNDMTIYEPASVRRSTDRYLFDSDPFSNFLEDNYLIIGIHDTSDDLTVKEDDCIRIDDIFKAYKRTDMRLKNMTKREFIDKFSSNLQYKEYFASHFIARDKVKFIDENKVIATKEVYSNLRGICAKYVDGVNSNHIVNGNS
jgi:phage/plasmid-associated DNA primase